jgi:hypothetical protein
VQDAKPCRFPSCGHGQFAPGAVEDLAVARPYLGTRFFIPSMQIPGAHSHY